MGLVPQTKYPQREYEECTRAVFSFLTLQFLMHIHLSQILTTYCIGRKHRNGMLNPKGSEIIYKKEELSKWFIYTWSIYKTSLLMEE